MTRGLEVGALGKGAVGTSAKVTHQMEFKPPHDSETCRANPSGFGASVRRDHQLMKPLGWESGYLIAVLAHILTL